MMMRWSFHFEHFLAYCEWLPVVPGCSWVVLWGGGREKKSPDRTFYNPETPLSGHINSLYKCIQWLLRLSICLPNWNILWNSLTEGIFIRCHPALNKCGLWCSLISACSTCSIWALFSGSVPQRLLKEPLHLCQGQVEICCLLLIGQSAFQTLSHHTQIRLSYKPGVNRGFLRPPALFCFFWSSFWFVSCTASPCKAPLPHFVSQSIKSLVLQINYGKSSLVILSLLPPTKHI